MPYFIVILGTAGSGKTTLTATLSDYLSYLNLDAAIVNLDPAAENLKYKPDVDVRDYVNAREVMEKYGLGPNGSLIVSADLIAARLSEISEEVSSLKANYIVIDTPGQLELFAFREAGPLIIRSLISGQKAVSLFLIDSILAEDPSSLLSSLLLASSINLRIGLSQINLLNKVDLIDDSEVKRIIEYMENIDGFIESLCSRREVAILWDRVDLEALIPRLTVYELIPVSATNWIGIDELYAAIQRVIAGGEDYLTEEPSPIL
ncbi:MAG: ATP/GTP-binding protein [Sulfolobales archaeon]|nr:ATP/GTP-binding protein [Sulfolobales archaeon]MCX8199361.1 ATP/GTP-binding protein [Sulfolobales archaeon]MDW8170325.1 ATP/GTP-binding protein [Desulfurococcaceae archaeon]